ncbi:MAG: hypothetical protein IJP41_09580 [Synergistaceae bacterium]|nr:hypothetical protein [Synergistaceae bacterium]
MKSIGVKKFQSLLFVSSVEMALTVVALISDTIIAAHLDNGATEHAISAINIMTPIIATLALISSMLTIGDEVLYNKALGWADKKHADEIFGMGLLIALTAGMIFYVVSRLGINFYLDFLNPHYDIRSCALEYFKYYQFVLILTPFSSLLIQMVYNDGDEAAANCANLMNVVGNIIFSIIFAFYFEMGISGIALGTLLKEIFSILILSSHFFKASNTLHAKLYFNFSECLSFITYGFVDSGMFLMWGILSFIMNKFVIAYYGSYYLPVLTMAFTLLEITFVFDGVAQAALPLTSVYYEERNYPAVRKIMGFAEKISIIEGVVVSIILFVFAEKVAFLFDINSPDLVRLSAHAIRIISLTLTFSSVTYLYETYYMITDKNFIAVISSCLRNLIFVAAISIPLGLFGNIDLIWLGFALSHMLSYIVCSRIMLSLYTEKELYLADDSNVADIDVELSPENIKSVVEQAEKFLLEHGIDKKNINRVLFTIEEYGMLILDSNPGKKILAEYTLLIKSNDNVELIVRDDGKINDITKSDSKIDSLRNYVFSLAVPKIFRKRNNVTATSINRNIFTLNEGE